MESTSEIRNLINCISTEIRDIYQIQIPITNIDRVVENMGGGVFEDASIDRFSSGTARKTGDDSFEILVYPFQTNEQRNFIVARGIGHLFLHMGFRTNEYRWKNQDYGCYQNNAELEYQANEFAHAFLMPEKEYKQIMDQCMDGNCVETSKIAKYFNVTETEAYNRGWKLGYLEW